MGWPPRTRSIAGNGVRRAQYLLRQKGHNIQPDHIFGPATEGAVKQFQQSKNLQVDGIIGDKTWAALLVTVKKGSTGEAVKAVQSQFPAADDGIFGPVTESQVKTFQTQVQLAADGIVGPLTWRALAGSPMQPPGTSG
ncbi:MAG: peptidoglycan-binding protein [Actinobacteria bacterium]|nr:peptidoglycan-binding protein [Actinomycetota bacterium]